MNRLAWAKQKGWCDGPLVWWEAEQGDDRHTLTGIVQKCGARALPWEWAVFDVEYNDLASGAAQTKARAIKDAEEALAQCARSESN